MQSLFSLTCGLHRKDSHWKDFHLTSSDAKSTNKILNNSVKNSFWEHFGSFLLADWNIPKSHASTVFSIYNLISKKKTLQGNNEKKLWLDRQKDRKTEMIPRESYASRRSNIYILSMKNKYAEYTFKYFIPNIGVSAPL